MLFIDYSAAFNTIVPSKLIIKLESLPSRTPTRPDVTGRQKRSSRTITTRATACSPHFHPEGEVSTGASKLGQLLYQGHQIAKQPSIAQRGGCVPTDLISLATLINGILVTLIMPL